MRMQKSFECISKNVSELYKNIDFDKVNKAIGAMLKSNKIFVYGVGRSGYVVKAFATRLGHLGIRTYVIGETITPPVNKDDCAVLMSGSGTTASVVKIAEMINKIGAKIIGITANEKSPLAETARIVLCLPVREDDVNGNLAPLGTVFEDAGLIVLDSMIAELMMRTGESEEEMSRRHATLE